MSKPNMQATFPMSIKEERVQPESKFGKVKIIYDVVSDRPLEKGEALESPIEPKMSATVVKVLESRPARGDWSNPIWGGVLPTWYRVEVE
jgi:hypothetical protein